ncbi:hypothetical protein [uncultured Clostridium sp.]|nr:hypothetical protein [uncultured Clostridium sp.]
MKLINLTVRIPEDLHKEFKVEMVLEGKTMQSHIIELIKDEVKRIKSSK